MCRKHIGLRILHQVVYTIKTEQVFDTVPTLSFAASLGLDLFKDRLYSKGVFKFYCNCTENLEL